MRSKTLNNLAQNRANELMQQAYDNGRLVLQAIKPLLSADERRSLAAHLQTWLGGDPDYALLESLRAVAGRAGVGAQFDKMCELTKTVDALGGSTIDHHQR